MLDVEMYNIKGDAFDAATDELLYSGLAAIPANIEDYEWYAYYDTFECQCDYEDGLNNYPVFVWPNDKYDWCSNGSSYKTCQRLSQARKTTSTCVASPASTPHSRISPAEDLVDQNNVGVMLPADGGLSGTGIQYWQQYGYYWSGETGSEADRAVCFYFYLTGSNNVQIGLGQMPRRYGMSVRCIHK